MPQSTEFDDDEWIDDEEDVEDDDADADEDLLICPSCTRPVHEDTQQCPHCGDWITPTYPTSPWKRAIWIMAALLVIAAMILLAVL